MKSFTSVSCLLVLAVTLLATVQTQAAETTTTTPATYNSSSSCRTAVLSCLSTVAQGNSSDGCAAMSSRLSCFFDTRDSNCSVDESAVTITNFLPIFSSICYEVASYSSCWQFASCLLGETDYAITVNAINYTVGPSDQQIASFTSTRFWCHYLHQTIDCVLRNTASCSFGQTRQTAVRALRGWLTVTCSGQADTVSKQCDNAVTICMTANIGQNKNCSVQLAEMICLSRSRTRCDINNTVVTFGALSTVLNDTCTAVNPYVSQCAALRECLASTDFARIPGLNTPEGPPTVVYDHLLNTYFWCRYLKQTINCFLQESQECQVPTARVNALDETTDLLTASCAGDSGNPGGWNYNAATSIMSTVFSFILLLVLAVYFTRTPL